MMECMTIDDTAIYRYEMPGIESNMYLIMEDRSALAVDPHVNEEAIQMMKENQVSEITILLTHEHFDHISGVNILRGTFDVNVIATEAAAKYLPDPNKNMAKFWKIMLMDLPQERIEQGMAVGDEDYSCSADKTFTGDIEFFWKGHTVHMQSAPGHSQGGALIFLDKLLFSGDNLVNGAGVICRMPGGNWKTYCDVTRPILESVSDHTWILPGHGKPDQFGSLKKYMQKFGHVL